MLSEQQLNALPDGLQEYFKQLERNFVDRICKRIGEIGSLTETDLHRIDELSRIGFDVAAMEKDIADILEITGRNVRKIFYNAAEEEYSGLAYDMAKIQSRKRLNVIPFAENERLQTLVDSVAKATSGEIKNISRTTGFVNARNKNGVILKNAEWQNLPTYYQNAVDYAVLQIRTGQTDFYSAIRSTINTMSDYGLRYAIDPDSKEAKNNVVRYASGYTRRLDTSVRSAILGGQARLSQAQAELVGEQIGADGYEITWHSGFIPTHTFGGEQFTKKEFEERIRPLMEEPNCYHRAFAVIIGVSTPTYSKLELRDLNKAESETHKWNGKDYNRYEATQVQRRYETAIRQYKDKAAANESAAIDDLKENNPEAYEKFKDAATSAKAKASAVNQEYSRFSDAMGLYTQPKRATVSGYTRGKSQKTLEKNAQEAYNITVTNAKKQINELSKTIIKGQQNKHIKNTKEFNDYVSRLAAKGQYGPSRINGGIEKAQILVNTYSGKGEPRIINGKWANSEIIKVNSEIIGIVVNNLTGAEAETTVFKIHYSTKGTHVVPDYPSKKGEK